MSGTIVFVIICNISIAAIAIFVAQKIWQLRRTLAGVAQTLNDVERSVYNILHPAPEAIAKGQTGIYNLKLAYQSKQAQIQQIRQFVTLIGSIYSLGVGKKRNSGGKLKKKRKKK
jgi:uncharacterized protein YoxC